ncbi:RNA pseudouridylate synthase domain containing protein 2 [Bulinus truncatus]|nr:RNA pseudouridylate synthase domain containing protein 2 [Bulinus truncatus]
MNECAKEHSNDSNNQLLNKPDDVQATELQTTSQPLSKRALKRIARAEKHKEFKKKKKEKADCNSTDDPGYTIEDLKQSSYYFENGLRKVYPYKFVFSTHAKGRWVGRRIYDVLSSEFGFDQPGDLEKAFESGLICVNNNPTTADYILKDCDYIAHSTHRHENPVTAAPIEIIENNDQMVVINKPSSIPCHPCGRYRFNSVVFILGKDLGLTNLRNIYRLDRLTSGVLILCKNTEITRKLMDQVAKRQVQKEYVCRVVGKFPDGTIKVDKPIKPLSNKLRLQVISPNGKSSQTTFTRLSYNGKSSVVKCVPHTGRTHQIRVHLQYLGHPIMNDVFYNNEAWGPNKGKDGVYEIPFDKVCERILKEHHVTQWDGGENPYYEDKLRELQSHELPLDCTDLASQDLNNDEPPIKQRKTGGFTVSAEEEVHIKLATSDSFSQRSSEGELTNDKTRQSESVEPSVSSCNLDSGLARPEFDLSKLTVDPDCCLCKKKTIDPKEKHLVMFLHALKYQGLDWAFETALPDWAREEWNREEECTVESFPCV